MYVCVRVSVWVCGCVGVGVGVGVWVWVWVWVCLCVSGSSSRGRRAAIHTPKAFDTHGWYVVNGNTGHLIVILIADISNGYNGG